MRFRLVITAVSLLAVGLLVTTFTAAPSAHQYAEPGSAPSEDMTIVQGTVYDTGGLPVIGADVNVSMYDNETLRSWLTDTTDSNGMYLITFGGMGGEPWGVNDTILVVAESGEYFGTNSTIAHDVDDPGPQQFINVTLSTVIPEFGKLGAMAPMGGLVVVFMALFFLRRKRET